MSKAKKVTRKSSRIEEPMASFNDTQKLALTELKPLFTQYLLKLANDRKRRRIIREMIETERNYVNSLQICEEVYYKPLDQSITSPKPLIDSASMAQLFGNIDQIRELHQGQILTVMDQSLAALSHAFPSPDVFISIAQTFINVAPKMQQLYTAYLKTNDNVDEVLKRLRKSKKFTKFLNKALFNPKAKCQEIEDLLILPTQRIAGYKLLFERVIKYFPQEQFKVENEKYTEALNSLSAVGAALNSEKTLDKETENELLNISENLSNAPPFFCLMKPGRKFQGKIKVKVANPEHGKKHKNMSILTMNDILLLTYPEKSLQGNNYVFIEAIPMTQVHFIEDPLSGNKAAVTLKCDTNEFHIEFSKSSELDNYRGFIKTLKKGIKDKVKGMTENGKDYMSGTLEKLRNLYLEPQEPRTRKQALESLD